MQHGLWLLLMAKFLNKMAPELKIDAGNTAAAEQVSRYRNVVFVPILPQDDVDLVNMIASGVPVLTPSENLLQFFASQLERGPEEKPAWPPVPEGHSSVSAPSFWFRRSVRFRINIQAFDSIAGACRLLASDPGSSQHVLEELRAFRLAQRTRYTAAIARLR
eukprot:TRINITY_DN25710_c0_g1_i1.p2 TRINITY_DN25710_c0_g1~~TRINITY_DN25710_c0_g1_i1.p2  ORF type:complete len:162 (-),score=36.42 TRINITY_DN25710_c0_g1_i1:385-870(-)